MNENKNDHRKKRTIWPKNDCANGKHIKVDSMTCVLRDD